MTTAPDPNLTPEEIEQQQLEATALGERIVAVLSGHDAGVAANALANEYFKLICYLSDTPEDAKADLKRIMEMAIAEAVDHFWPYTRGLRAHAEAERALRKGMH